MKQHAGIFASLQRHLLRTATGDPELAARHYNLNIALLSLIIPGMIFGLAALVLLILDLGPPMPVAASLGLVFVFMLAYIIGRRGWIRLASVLPPLALLFAISFGIISTDLNHLAITGLAVVVTFSGFIYGIRGALICTLVGLALYLLAPTLGALAPPEFVFTPTAYFAYSALGLGLGLLTLIELNWLATRPAAIGDELERRAFPLEQEPDFAENLIRTAHVLIVVLDLDGRVLRVNPFTEKVTGYAADEVLGLDWFQTFIPQQERPWIQSVFDEVLSSPTIHREVNTILTKNGDELLIEWHSSTLHDAQNRPSAVLAIGVDLTEQKHAREAVTAREAQVASLFRNSPVGIGVVEKRTFKVLNDRFCEMVGYSHQELINQNTRMLYLDEEAYLQTGERLYALMQETGIGIAETRFLRKDGTIIDVLISLAAIDPNQPEGEISFTMQDITEMKQTEAKLRLSEYSINQAGEAILWIGSGGRLLRANPTACRMLGYEERELLHMRHSDIRVDLKESSWDAFWSTLSAERAVVEQTFWRHRDGRMIPVEVADCFFTFEGTDYIMAFARDMTELIETQELAKAQERLAAIGQLAAGIAHDFNNIMAGIILYSQMLQREEGISEPGRERLERIRAQAHRGSDLISQILDFSRQSMLALVPTDVGIFLADLRDLLRRMLPENIQIEIDTDGAPYIVNADPSRLQQIILNLGINARDAMPDGGLLKIILDGIEITPDKPGFMNMAAGEWIRLQVIDSGVGIPPEHMRRVFEPFFTTKEPGKGTGLGLAQVFGIVKQHDGYIDVTSEIGQGTRFVIYLPRGVVEKIDTPRTETSTQLDFKLRVLLVEDDDSVRAAIFDMLEYFGCTVREAKTGYEALEILRDSHGSIDLVLSDMVMPSMGGRQLFEAIRVSFPRLNFILMTGYPLGHDTSRLIDRQYAILLRKPFTAEELGVAIRTSRQRLLRHRNLGKGS